MVEMTLKNLIVGGGPIPSAIILKPAPISDDSDVENLSDPADLAAVGTEITLPISVGTADAANVARAIDSDDIKRPTTHMLLAATLEVLGASLAGVTIERVEGATFFATLDVVNATGEHHHIDARPSDAVALAITCDEPIFASREVLECAGSPDFDAIEKDERAREEAKFHDFVEGLSPDDFKAPRQN